MKKFLLFALLGSGLAAGAQKTIHDANADRRNVSSFHSIRVSGGIDLFLSYGDEAVAVSARDIETRNAIKVEVTDGVLRIGYDWKEGNIFTNSKQMKAYVSYKTLKSLAGSGGSDIAVDGTIKGVALALNISGGSDFKGKVEVDELKVDASGGSDVQISGRAKQVNVDANGGSDFSGFDLLSETANVAASGGCDVEISVSKDINARASGGSDVRYRGSPSVRENNASGSSSVKRVSR
jgi:hypothetical protein